MQGRGPGRPRVSVVEKKRPRTFMLTDGELDRIENHATLCGFKNRSELLRSISKRLEIFRRGPNGE